MIKIVDLGKAFDKYISGYVYKNIGKVKPEEIENKIATVEVLKTNAIWQGITYKEDKEKVVKEIKKLVDNNEYPKDLWK